MSQGPLPDLEHYIDLFERESLRKRLFIGAFRSEDPESKYCYLPLEGLLRAMKEARDIIELFEPSGPHGHFEDGPLGDGPEASKLNRKERRKRAAMRRSQS